MHNAPRLDINGDSLRQCFETMHRRVWELGLERYDSTDALSHPFFLRLQMGRRRINGYYALRLIEYFLPILSRRTLGVQPTLTPSTLYHLGIAYLNMSNSDPERRGEWTQDVRRLCKIAWETRLVGEYAAWAHPHGMHKGDWVRQHLLRPGIPDSCCHHTTRLGRLFLEAGNRFEDEALLAQGRSAVNALLEYHNWHLHQAGGCSISYYPDTDDGTINTAAEVASLLAHLPSQWLGQREHDRLSGLLKFMLDEQGDEGQWRYAGREHESRLGRSGEPDNHHTAMNLTALAELFSSDHIDAGHHNKMLVAIERGVEFYLQHFTRQDGYCYGELGQKRCAEITGYCEGSKMLLAVARLPALDSRLRGRILERVPRILACAIALFYNPSTGDVGCNRRFGKTYCVRSIRWGSGPLLEAISECLRWNAEVDVKLVSAHCVPSSPSGHARAVA